MGKKIVISNQETKSSGPYLTPEARENELMSLAYDLAEEQLRNGTASSQVMTHFLKLRTERERRDLELDKLRNENRLLKAKSEAYDSEREKNRLYAEAIRAMGIYSGTIDENEVTEMEKQEIFDDFMA